MTAHNARRERSGQGKGPARPTEPTPELTRRICRRVEENGRPDLAARLEDVDGPTYDEWTARGALEEDGRYAEFVHAVMKAEASFICRLLARIMTAAAKGDAEASEWILERGYPDLFSRKTRVSIRQRIDPAKGVVQEQVSVADKVRDPERIGRLLQVLLRTEEFDRYLEELGWRRTAKIKIMDSTQPER